MLLAALESPVAQVKEDDVARDNTVGTVELDADEAERPRAIRLHRRRRARGRAHWRRVCHIGDVGAPALERSCSPATGCWIAVSGREVRRALIGVSTI